MLAKTGYLTAWMSAAGTFLKASVEGVTRQAHDHAITIV
jgi:hypothetical protein